MTTIIIAGLIAIVVILAVAGIAFWLGGRF